MLSVYFLLGVFCLSVLGMVIALIMAFKWHKDDRCGGACVIASALFFTAFICGSQIFWRLDAAEKAELIRTK